MAVYGAVLAVMTGERAQMREDAGEIENLERAGRGLMQL
jgi:hypothetical protein